MIFQVALLEELVAVYVFRDDARAIQLDMYSHRFVDVRETSVHVPTVPMRVLPKTAAASELYI